MGSAMTESAAGNIADESDRRVEFAAELRELRERAGSPSFRKMAMRSGAISHTTLHEAAIGARFPSWATTREFVLALDADEAEWRARWTEARQPAASSPDTTTTPDSATTPAPDPYPSGQPDTAAAPAPTTATIQDHATDDPSTDIPTEAAAPQSPGVPITASAPRRKATAILVAVLAVLVISAVPIAFALGGTRQAAARPPATATDSPSGAAEQNLVPGPRIPGDASKFVADVSIPDGTTVRPGEHFTKVWEIANTGTVDWHGRFLRREGTPTDNQSCGTPDEVPIPDTTAGSHVLISAPVVAAAETGSCWVGWKMVDSAGNYLFLGSRPVYFMVNIRP